MDASAAALVILGAAVLALLGRIMMLREERVVARRRRPEREDQRLDRRDPRDLFILVLALVLGIVSVSVLLGAKLGL